MAHSLGLKALAEGVENEAQLQYLKSTHCDFIQGYYTGKAMPAAELIELYSIAELKVDEL